MAGPCAVCSPCDSRALASDAPQLRPRPAVSVSPMARQPAGAAGDRGEEGAVCAAVASVCRTVDRHAATRMRGSAAVLVCVGLGRQTGGLPGLLQCASGPCVVGRADARPDTKGCRTARPLPMGRALPWSRSDADRGVTSDQRRRWRAAIDAPAFDVYRDTAGQCVSCTPYSCHRDNFAGDSRRWSRDPKIERCSDSYEFATHTLYVATAQTTGASLLARETDLVEELLLPFVRALELL